MLTGLTICAMGGLLLLDKDGCGKNTQRFVVFRNNEMPDIFLIQATEWKPPNALLKVGVYPEALPDYGIRYSQKNMDLLNEYRFENKIKDLLGKIIG